MKSKIQKINKRSFYTFFFCKIMYTEASPTSSIPLLICTFPLNTRQMLQNNPMVANNPGMAEMVRSIL